MANAAVHRAEGGEEARPCVVPALKHLLTVRVRRRLELLISLFPPPEGYAVLPEQLKAR